MFISEYIFYFHNLDSLDFPYLGVLYRDLEQANSETKRSSSGPRHSFTNVLYRVRGKADHAAAIYHNFLYHMLRDQEQSNAKLKRSNNWYKTTSKFTRMVRNPDTPIPYGFE